MKILILAGSLPYPPASGGALRTLGIIKGLHESGHEITLLTFNDTHSNTNSPLDNYCQQIITVPFPERSKTDRIRDLITSNQPDIAKRLYSEAFVTELKNLLNTKTFDLVQAEGIESAIYLPTVKQLSPSTSLCFDTFNAEYVLQEIVYKIDRQEIKRLPQAVYSFIQANRIKSYEAMLCQLADCVIAVSPEDAEILREFRSDQTVHLLPSGIDVDSYESAQQVQLQSPSLIFTGKMDYRPNVDAMLWFGQEIFPRVTAQYPEAHLYIVGQKPHTRLDVLRPNQHITLTGWVDSVTPYLHASDVYIAPLRMGSGTRLKLLEAMASECAIVATDIAASGLLPAVKQCLSIANTEEAFANAIIDLLKNTSQDIGKEARIQVKQYYDWSVLIPDLLNIYRSIGLG